MKRVLITGGAGFIGSRLANKLVARGISVTVLDNLSPQIHGEEGANSELYQSIRQKCDVVVGDVRDRETWIKALDGVDSVVHLAAETGTGQSMYQISRYVDVNISGTATLLDLLVNDRFLVERVVVASSRAIYGEGKYLCKKHGVFYPGPRSQVDVKEARFQPLCEKCGRPMEAIATDEESAAHPTSIYGLTKQVQEQLVLQFGNTSGMPVSALRYQNVYGPGQSLKNPYTGILSIFSTSLLKGNKLDIYEDGLETRDFVFIDDVVDATEKALELPRGTRRAVNVGSGVATSVLEVAETLRSLYSSESPIQISGRYREGDIRHNFADLTLARRVLNFEPSVSFKSGIMQFVDWVRTQEPEEDRYAESMKELERRGLLK